MRIQLKGAEVCPAGTRVRLGHDESAAALGQFLIYRKNDAKCLASGGLGSPKGK